MSIFPEILLFKLQISLSKKSQFCQWWWRFRLVTQSCKVGMAVECRTGNMAGHNNTSCLPIIPSLTKIYGLAFVAVVNFLYRLYTLNLQSQVVTLDLVGYFRCVASTWLISFVVSFVSISSFEFVTGIHWISYHL